MVRDLFHLTNLYFHDQQPRQFLWQTHGDTLARLSLFSYLKITLTRLEISLVSPSLILEIYTGLADTQMRIVHMIIFEGGENVSDFICDANE